MPIHLLYRSQTINTPTALYEYGGRGWSWCGTSYVIRLLLIFCKLLLVFL
jgi:hypothetical protein